MVVTHFSPESATAAPLPEGQIEVKQYPAYLLIRRVDG